MVLVLLSSRNFYMSTLCLVLYALLLTPTCWKSNNTNARLMAFTPWPLSCFGPHIWNSLPQDLRHCSTLPSFKAKLKTFLFSGYFCPNWENCFAPLSATVIVCACTHTCMIQINVIHIWIHCGWGGGVFVFPCGLFWWDCVLCVYRTYLG